ncbi:MAG: slipin family protein [Acetobacteraceae bacterium]|nr:slipin family protein [Acetobacteraceae bacterium]
MPVIAGLPRRDRDSSADADRESVPATTSLRVHPFAVLVFLLVVLAGVYYTVITTNPVWVIAAVVVGALLASAIRVVNEWERAAVLRLGKFRRMAGPGLFLVIPILDSVPYIVDLRIVPYNVPSQKTLTRDNVPVTVDAIVYYQVADPQAAVLKIENYRQATQWGAAAVLRDLIGKSTLDEVLSERERLGQTIRATLDGLTGAWGIKVPNVEIRDVFIAEQLEDAIAREPAAEREKRARLKLAEAEKLAAGIITEAADIYARDPVALQLRSMNMLFEMAMEGKNTIIFVPTETRIGLPSPLGVFGLVEKLERREGRGEGGEG